MRILHTLTKYTHLLTLMHDEDKSNMGQNSVPFTTI